MISELKIRLKMENILYRYDINRPRLRHGLKHIKYKMSVSIMMVICIKEQHLSNSIHEKVKQH